MEGSVQFIWAMKGWLPWVAAARSGRGTKVPDSRTTLWISLAEAGLLLKIQESSAPADWPR